MQSQGIIPWPAHCVAAHPTCEADMDLPGTSHYDPCKMTMDVRISGREAGTRPPFQPSYTMHHSLPSPFSFQGHLAWRAARLAMSLEPEDTV